MHLNWRGPCKIGDYLDNAITRTPSWDKLWPPSSNAVYLVSLKRWKKKPTRNCVPLYVGGTTGKSRRFCTRVGDLVADLFGFYVPGHTGHHSGGQSLHQWCYE